MVFVDEISFSDVLVISSLREANIQFSTNAKGRYLFGFSRFEDCSAVFVMAVSSEDVGGRDRGYSQTARCE